jgi:hypothetical protein
MGAAAPEITHRGAALLIMSGMGWCLRGELYTQDHRYTPPGVLQRILVEVKCSSDWKELNRDRNAVKEALWYLRWCSMGQEVRKEHERDQAQLDDLKGQLKTLMGARQEQLHLLLGGKPPYTITPGMGSCPKSPLGFGGILQSKLCIFCGEEHP